MNAKSIKTFLLVLAMIPLGILASFTLSIVIVLAFFDKGGEMVAIGQAVLFGFLGCAISLVIIPLAIFLVMQFRDQIIRKGHLAYIILYAGLTAAAGILMYIIY
ncbi:MAG: hypothetical protein KBA61_13965 [Spirochaetes bacterium]|nr:hypothetical protein [Spirochaetota bacterium]